MKISKTRLKEIIKEEFSRPPNEKNEVTKDAAAIYLAQFGIANLKELHDAGKLDSIFDEIPIHDPRVGLGTAAEPGEWHILEYLEAAIENHTPEQTDPSDWLGPGPEGVFEAQRMKISKTRLKEIIKEEFSRPLDEAGLSADRIIAQIVDAVNAAPYEYKSSASWPEQDEIEQAGKMVAARIAKGDELVGEIDPDTSRGEFLNWEEGFHVEQFVRQLFGEDPYPDLESSMPKYKDLWMSMMKDRQKKAGTTK